MEVEVVLEGIGQLSAKLRHIPGGSEFALKAAIFYSLKRGRTSAVRDARLRYTAPYMWLLRAISNPRMQGLSGFMRASGTKAPLGLFPSAKDEFPQGVTVQELRGHTMRLLHAFMRAGKVLQRETPQTGRLPVAPVTGISAPAMIGQRTQVFPMLQASIQKDVNKELARLIQLVLAGDVVPRT